MIAHPNGRISRDYAHWSSLTMYLTDCGQPTEEETANGYFIQEFAFLLCKNGYEGGGEADCIDGTWAILPCTAKGNMATS